MVSVLSYKAKKAGVEIRCELLTSQLIFGNPLKLHRIIANLLSNAIDAYDKVTISPTPKLVTLTLTKELTNSLITVSDNGSGISEEQKIHIFEPFFTTKGMGIGLSSTKNIVEKDFHGTISFICTPGTGTSFTVRIPQTSSPAAV